MQDSNAIDNPIPVDKTSLRIGLGDISWPYDDFFQTLEWLLATEPIVESILLANPERPNVEIHHVGMDGLLVERFYRFCGYSVRCFYHSDQKTYDETVHVCLKETLRSGNYVRPVRKLPYFKNLRYSTEPRPLFYNTMTNFAELRESEKAKFCAENFENVVTFFQNHDIVATDSLGIALLATACNVPEIILQTQKSNLGRYEHLDLSHIFFMTLPASAGLAEQALDSRISDQQKTYVRYRPILHEGNAQTFIQGLALKYCRGHGLDVGSSAWPLPGAIPSDKNSRRFDLAPFDFIFSSHCLEHIEDWWAELNLWHESLNPDGITFLYLPHPAMELWLPGGKWVGSQHVWSPDPITIANYLRGLGHEILEQTTHPGPYWSFHVISRKR